MGYTGTTNYGFQKPAKENAFTVDDLNNALDKIDETIKDTDDKNTEQDGRLTAVESKNTSQDQDIAGKVAIAQGMQNAGKYLAVGDDGNVTPISSGVNVIILALPKAYQLISKVLDYDNSQSSGTGPNIYGMDTIEEDLDDYKALSITSDVIPTLIYKEIKYGVKKSASSNFWYEDGDVSFTNDEVKTILTNTGLKSNVNISFTILGYILIYTTGDGYGSDYFRSSSTYAIQGTIVNGVVTITSNGFSTAHNVRKHYERTYSGQAGIMFSSFSYSLLE